MLKEKLSLYRTKVLSLVLIVEAVLIVGCGCPNIVEDTKSYNIAPGDQKVINLELEVNEKVDLIVEVDDTNASDPPEFRDIGIMVVNPSGQYVVSYMRVGRGEFMVLAEEAGVYEITLDNSYSSSVAKIVSLTIKYRE